MPEQEDLVRTADELMTPDPQCIAGDDDVAGAARLMRSQGVGALPVLADDGAVTGVISQADVARHLSAGEIGHTVGSISGRADVS